MPLQVLSDPDLPGVWRLTTGKPGPVVGVIGSLHGNEPCGLRAIERLRDAATAGDLPLERGTLLLIHGNPTASAEGRRYTAGGADMNRLFDYTFLEELPPERWTVEHHRAYGLRPVLAELELALDLHAATAPTPPFVVVTRAPGSLELGLKLGVGCVAGGWDRPGWLGNRVLLTVLTEQGLPSVAVECGQRGSETATEIAHRVAAAFLATAGLTAASPRAEASPPLHLSVREILTKPSPNFRFERPVAGLDQFRRGETIGHDGGIEIRAREARYALLPNDDVEVGKDVVYLACEDPTCGLTR